MTTAAIHSNKQRGAALFTALIILVAITLISLASLGTTMLELKMAGNEESRMVSFQMAQAAVDNVIVTDKAAQDPLNPNLLRQYFKLAGNKFDTNCTVSHPDSCTANDVLLDSPLDDTAKNQVKITRLTDPTALRSTACAEATTFTIESKYSGVGTTDVVQGYIACTYVPNDGRYLPQTAVNN